jgi:hypothetical protein
MLVMEDGWGQCLNQGEDCVMAGPEGQWFDFPCEMNRFYYASADDNRAGKRSDAGADQCAKFELPYICAMEIIPREATT